MSEIKLSPKYGVNPTIPVCFWCGKQKNEIALMGRMGNTKKGEDLEAPKSIVLDYEPCENCKKHMALGTTVMEATPEPNRVTDIEIQKGVYPTGRWVVIDSAAAKRVFNVSEDMDKCFLEKEVFQKAFIRESEVS